MTFSIEAERRYSRIDVKGPYTRLEPTVGVGDTEYADLTMVLALFGDGLGSRKGLG